MSYKVEVSARFEKDVKKLAKKYDSIKADLAALVSTLKEQPHQGVPLSDNCY